ncbi:MAG: protein-glutamate O-methyltransferase CheR [Oscillospiraceae bacterium]|nr:protein-glutamate O-methyltransferase CheR [Oscillospiraceae bacterium]
MLASQNTIGEKEFKLFKDYIEKLSGIVIPPEKAYFIETRLYKLMLDYGTESFGDFYALLTSDVTPEKTQKLINAVTVNETHWFRDAAPWQVMEKELLPELVKKLSLKEKVRVKIWSAAAATGQEIYSTVMCVDKYLKNNPAQGVSLSDFYFYATDISSRVLDYAKRGRYDRISMNRGLDDFYRDTYFSHDGAAWDIDAKIRSAVRFEQFNLQQDFSKMGQFDIIFCRYVLIYFSEAFKKEIVKKMYDALSEGGVIFIGSYILYDYFKEYFEVRHDGNLTYYVKKAELK